MKSKYNKNYEDCNRSGLFTFEPRIIEGKKYIVKCWHFEVCKSCKEDCNGKAHYRIKKFRDIYKW